MRTPGTRSSTVSPRRPAHCVHTVTVPADRIAASRYCIGAAPSRSYDSERPGTPNHDASPVSHSDTDAPAATAVAATVNACEHLSGSSAPAVSFTTRSRMAVSVRGPQRERTTVTNVLQTLFTALLVLVALAV